jgi:hypothetical protein
MATESQVKDYVAYWLQLGKRVALRNGQKWLRPTQILAENRYSPEFEACWDQVRTTSDCYIEGTGQAVAQLLTDEWDITDCARCGMLVPMPAAGMPIFQTECPCADMPDRPNNESIPARAPISTDAILGRIRERLQKDRPD